MKLTLCLFAFLVAVSSAVQAPASTIIEYQDGTSFYKKVGFDSTPLNVDGLRITAHFDDGSTIKSTFTSVSREAATVDRSTGLIAVVYPGRTAGLTGWDIGHRIDGVLMTKFILEGAPGGVAFDTIDRPFEEGGVVVGDFKATYSNRIYSVMFDGTPVLDYEGIPFYETLEVDVSQLAGGGLFRSQILTFGADIDVVRYVSAPVSEVPLPAGFPMLLSALTVLGLLRRRCLT